jgi:hypothetical protein
MRKVLADSSRERTFLQTGSNASYPSSEGEDSTRAPHRAPGEPTFTEKAKVLGSLHVQTARVARGRGKPLQSRPQSVRYKREPGTPPKGVTMPTRTPMLTIRAYARHRRELGLLGGATSSVQDALRTGRIWRSCSQHTRCPLGCPAGRIPQWDADRAWRANTMPMGKEGRR